MSSQLLNGPRGLAFVLTPPVRRRGAASVRRGMRPSAGSTTSHARLFVALLDDLVELRRRDVGQRLPRELRRPLHRRPGLIIVGVDALQIRMSPRSFRRRIRLRAKSHSRHRNAHANDRKDL